MGNDDGFDREKPAHPVAVSDFWMGQYPVTQAQWKALMGADHNPSFFVGDQRPVERVSWHDCQSFLSKINALQKDDQNRFRLPTEAEWEYAARGGIHQNHFAYAGSSQLKKVGWYNGNSHQETKDVGLLQPNALGLYDMSGNVYEWCWDWYSESYYRQCKRQGRSANPDGPNKGAFRVLRGGSWISNPAYCRVANRGWDRPEYADDFLGFRLVLAPSEVERFKIKEVSRQGSTDVLSRLGNRIRSIFNR